MAPGGSWGERKRARIFNPERATQGEDCKRKEKGKRIAIKKIRPGKSKGAGNGDGPEGTKERGKMGL